MERQIFKWNSPNLNKEMEIVVYGYYGYALLLFPTADSDYLEYERFHLIDSIADYIKGGMLKVFCINSINAESWLNKDASPAYKIERQLSYNKYISEEVLPFINRQCNGNVPVVLSGASLGAFHAANNFFRMPELFSGLIAMSGTFDLTEYTNDFFNDDCYYNSPVHFLPNLADEKILKHMRNKNIIIASGQGDYEDPEASKQISGILHEKNIPHWLDLWGPDVVHDWSTWRSMLPYYLNNLSLWNSK